MQGDPHTRAGNGRRYLATLVTAHLAAAGLVVLLLSVAGDVLLGWADVTTRVVVVAVAGGGAAVIDLRSARRRRMGPGLRRQTPKSLAYDSDAPWWLTPFVWGADTGMMWTTFRVSSATWVVFLAALLGLSPPAAGLAYGLAFTVPLSVSVLVGSGRHIGRIGARFAGRSAQVVQVVAAAVLVVPAVALAAGWTP